MKTTYRLLLCAALAIPFASSAQGAVADFPARPISLVVPYGAGGGTDLFARQMGEFLSKVLKQPVVVENKPGAGTTIAATYVARAPADGYTILLGDTATFAYNKYLYSELRYDPQESFEPVSLTSRGSMILASSKTSNIASLQQLIDAMKTKPSAINYASAGVGTPPHIFMEAFKQAVGASKMNHVPYRGELPGVTDLIAGTIDSMFMGSRSAQVHADSGRINLLGWGMSPRVKEMPDLPVIAEVVEGFEQVVWQGLVVPKGTPAAVVAKLNKAVRDAFASGEFQSWLAKQAPGVEYGASSPEQMRELIAEELVRAQNVIRSAGIVLE